jgi:hypothetical protein
MYIQTSTIQPGIGTELIQRKELVDRGCAQRCGGLGLFDSMDFTTWSWPEWGVVGLLGFALYSMVSTTKRGAKRIQRKLRRRKAV